MYLNSVSKFRFSLAETSTNPFIPSCSARAAPSFSETARLLAMSSLFAIKYRRQFGPLPSTIFCDHSWTCSKLFRSVMSYTTMPTCASRREFNVTAWNFSWPAVS
ncbi:hypothetical protein TRFO_02625 [Tritrichomonas foetus]|uniref:Uncharacterized protein n=1 Tax=Tritrichomonas foetus TaxID=1144522 RepID=A0A1J4L6I5_9EUKA|nr:hypothetical protein TRFO_02625 [Tritrichomonas foetus]|eukprot:OHT17558.1 hypothetical protein TRFO_02625 [Tritrichomonas foetus]